MIITTTINSELRGRRRKSARPDRLHRLALCEVTGLARYRDRHQAKQAAELATMGRCPYRVTSYACPACGGFHLERITTPTLSKALARHATTHIKITTHHTTPQAA